MSEADTWPAEIETDYKRVSPLGSGSFGTVWMVKKKHDNAASGDDEYFAIKGIDTSKPNSRTYADREINILSKLHHPNIIKIIRVYDPTPSKCLFAVMTLARGPSLGTLIELGGCLSIPLAQLLARTLIAAVSYLHGRAVIHRDIKPDNCILVMDAKSKGHYSPEDSNQGNDSIWSRGQDAKKAIDEGKWKIVLVDFGLARALTPNEVNDESKKTNPVANSSSVKDKEIEAPASQKLSNRTRKRGSFARMLVRGMSAVGSRYYAAPEVERKVRKKEETDKKIGAEALTDCVADYGMISDAYSIGVTLREALTGVPPNAAVAKYIDENYSPVYNFFSSLLFDSSQNRCREFRYLSEVPKDAAELIGKMTKPNVNERLSVREARMHPWIRGADGEEKYVLPKGDYPSRHGDPIVYLEGNMNPMEP
mmetsp:Transcript_7956/g.10651  ORF Transcript_7956/g.10651 Transcript_7956/m.10651 type:complete len:423 (-) Transcript_7956:210-1478(-)